MNDRLKKREYYKRATCECGSTEEIEIHEFTDAVLCTDCLNTMFREAEDDDTRETRGPLPESLPG